MGEGLVKFDCRWIRGSVTIPVNVLQELDHWRTRLREVGLLGINDEGIGFGNISVRQKGMMFLITGSGTGGIPRPEPRHYSLVEDFCLAENRLACRGGTKASSESLSHGAIYAALSSVGAVVHVHCGRIWEQLYERLPTTDPAAEYGTPEMAQAIGDLVTGGNVVQTILMGGHRDGVISFGPDLSQAGTAVLELRRRLLDQR